MLPGSRVVVQFGSRKLYTGLVYDLTTDPSSAKEIKEIIEVPDSAPLVNETQFAFWEWMSEYYLCHLGEVMNAALPAGLKPESESRIVCIDPEFEPESSYQKVFHLIRKHEGISLGELCRITGRKSLHRELSALMESGAVSMDEYLKPSGKTSPEFYLMLNKNAGTEDMDRLLRSPAKRKSLETLLKMEQKGELPVRWKEAAGLFGSSMLRKLLEDGYITKETGRVSPSESFNKPAELNPVQLSALESINRLFKEKEVVLLHGVTSSGKTEIYIHLIHQMFAEGKQVLYLLPEIALTSQMVERLRKVMGSRVLVYHSRFSGRERVEVYHRVKKAGEPLLVLGARSALFLPFNNPGLIIVDEEHENTFKQSDPAPRYHARDAAIVLARMHGAKVLLGTATPSMETYANTRNGKYGKVELLSRYGKVPMPEILVADLTKARKKREMRSVFTPLLISEMEAALSAGRQVILFQNRRGYSSIVRCESCNWIPQCRTCDVSLTYHRNPAGMICHYCGYTHGIPASCPECGSTRLTTAGFGTELVEDEVSMIFPSARLARLDLDSSRNTRSYEKILTGFSDGDIDILVGTQMLSKGLDFERVSLVGILNADQMLNYPDFRAHERSFQLMAQVSGRAGRKDLRGKVVIQTGDPGHPVIRHVVHHDFEGMYREQFMERQAFAYPPFTHLVRLEVKAKEERESAKAADILGEKLRKVFGQRVLGPQAPPVARVRSYYLKHILLKIEKKASFARARDLVRSILEEAVSEDAFKKVRVNADVDPL